jgi:hypothetical protein
MAVYVLFAGWFLFDVRTLAVHHRRHVARYYGIYHSPTHSDFDPLVGFLRAHTPKHSTLVYPPFYADVLPAVTGQMGLFMYLECPTVDYITSNCKERMAYGQALAADLERLEQASPPSSGLCLPALDRLPPPVYVIWPTQVLKLREETFAHCKDVQHVGMHGNFAVLAPRDDTGFWRPAHVER